MTRLLFVCLGNICRSPAAEAIMRARAEAEELRASLDSAGTGSWHVGAAPDPRMQAAAAARGHDLSALRARQVRREDFRNFDLILAMDEGNLAALQRLAPASGGAELSLMLDHGSGPKGAEVPDPYFGGEAGFDHVLDLLEDAAEGLARRLRAAG